MKCFDLLFLSANRSQHPRPMLSCPHTFLCQPPLQTLLCPWVAQDLFSGVLLGAASAPVQLSRTQRPANPVPSRSSGVCLVEGWGLGVVFWLVAGFFAVYFLPIKRSKGDSEKQSDVSSGLSSVCSRNNSHFSRFYLFPKRKAKRRKGILLPRTYLASQMLLLQPLVSKEGKKVYLRLVVCSYLECKSIPSPESGSASPLRKQFRFSPKEREMNERK